MKIASALGMDLNMSPPTWDTPSYAGAKATTCGRSKSMPLRCGYAFTSSATAPPVTPPTSTSVQMQPNPSLYTATTASMAILACICGVDDYLAWKHLVFLEEFVLYFILDVIQLTIAPVIAFEDPPAHMNKLEWRMRQMRVSEDTISCDDPDEVLVPNL
ncbi:hypothetical protein CK203_014059 [Vitis vinifera]|uniref:Uncharacterized protein n=1 Tax=Vitis vinifera TaxID=29760 RepID=A0A438JHN4_VITVI|nr:hypothetical protein CK203_014059 [Vitis vinifera]